MSGHIFPLCPGLMVIQRMKLWQQLSATQVRAAKSGNMTNLFLSFKKQTPQAVCRVKSQRTRTATHIFKDTTTNFERVFHRDRSMIEQATDGKNSQTVFPMPLQRI